MSLIKCFEIIGNDQSSSPGKTTLLNCVNSLIRQLKNIVNRGQISVKDNIRQALA